MRRVYVVIVLTVIGAVLEAAWSPGVRPEERSAGTSDPGTILVELALAADRKGDLPSIKEEFAAVGVTKVRAQIYRAGRPPTNIAIGPAVPASIARLAFRLAQDYNGGVTLLLPEERLAPHYVGFGSSIFDELFQYPVSQDDVARLTDPTLTTEQFHALYRQLADINTRRDRR